MDQQYQAQWEDLQEEDLDQWRRHPVTAAFLGYLKRRETSCMEEVLNDNGAGEHTAAQLATGAVREVRAVAREIASTKMKAPEPAADSTYVDPATRPSLLRGRQ